MATSQDDPTIRRYRTTSPEGWGAYLAAFGVWLTLNIALLVTTAPSTATIILLQASLFAAFGGIALWFARGSGALHSRVSAPAFLTLAVLAVPTAAGAVPLNAPLLMVLWLLTFLGALGIERLTKGPKDGSDINV